MSNDGGTSRAPQGQRQAAIDRLMEAFAEDVLDVDEFERRLDQAHAATTSAELQALLSDLPRQSNLPATPGQVARSGVPASAPTQSYSVAHEGQVKESEYVVAVMGGSSRRGHWHPARKNYAVAVMGGTELDFREAVLPPGVTEVQVWAMWGGVDIIVPPGVNGESRGIALLGPGESSRAFRIPFFGRNRNTHHPLLCPDEYVTSRLLPLADLAWCPQPGLPGGN